MAAAPNLLFPLRIGRISYLVRYLIFFLLVCGGSASGAYADNVENSALKIAGFVVMVAALGFALFWFFRGVLIPRMRDVGMKPIYALLILVPFVNTLFTIVLLVWEGETWREKQTLRLKPQL
jgi:uncharacterized membrane protein YhaH (DUF805 family)